MIRSAVAVLGGIVTTVPAAWVGARLRLLA